MNKKFTFIVIIFAFVWKLTRGSNLFDVCRVTRSGSEYVGKISETRSGKYCQNWEAVGSDDLLKDHDFPDGSKKAARNFCRNPNGSPQGPWCYARLKPIGKENCTIPTCSSTDSCKVTGPGMEYSGNKQKSIFENECLHWAATIKNDDNLGIMLPEGNIMLAGKSCRNPTGSLAGPWCYVLAGDIFSDNEEEGSWIKELCDVPTCFDEQFIAVIDYDDESEVGNYYTHFSSIQNEKEEISFSVKFWNPEDWKTGQINIAISSLAIPVNGHQLRNWDIGYEIILRNFKGGITPSKSEEETWEDHPGLMNGIRWASFRLSWSNGFISLTSQENDKPYFLHEYKEIEGGILSDEKAKIKYVSLIGKMTFLNFSQDQSFCEEHITTNLKISRHWPYPRVSLTKFLSFYLRSKGNCIIEFKISPPLEFPRVQLRMEAESGKTSVTLYQINNVTKILSSSLLVTPLTYWKWSEFSISISGNRFQVLITTKKGLETLFDFNNIIFQAIKWYGIASDSVSHWSLFCKPAQVELEAIPPECSVSDLDVEYEGHQWISEKGHPCLPWIAYIIKDLENNKFPDGSVAAALNYCRNPTADQYGSFCYAIELSSKKVEIIKEPCTLRKCKFKDCRIAGTANDFMGQISTTISGRECQSWTSNKPHITEKIFLNKELFPERSVEDAKNYCRDPSLTGAGPWCYTSDPKVKIDLCYVPDCFKPTSCTVIVKTKTNKKVFIVPQWRVRGIPMWIKMWNPNIVTALELSFYPRRGLYKYQLILGDDDNDNIKLYYISESGVERLLKQKTSPHFLSSGRWTGIIINLQDNEINISYEGIPKPFFIWKKGEYEYFPSSSAMFFSYGARSENDKGAIGLNFPCDVCQTEVCDRELSPYSVFYPTNIWLEDAPLLLRNITFHLKGNGVVIFNFHVLPSKFASGKLIIDDGSFGDLIEMQMIRTKYLDRIAIKHKGSPAVVDDFWSNITLIINETGGSLFLNGTDFNNWKNPSIPLYYYFSVQCKGQVTWVANCPPPQIDGVPIDGGWTSWSAWECSATCGGGRGLRRRNCTNPEPSMFGRTCEGSPIKTGICNENACGEVSISTINNIRKNLGMHANNIQVYVQELIDIKCNPAMLTIIKKESRKSSLYWNKNGIKISQEAKIEEVDVNNFKILIASANVSDTGVYACIFVRPGEAYEIVDVIAVTVKSKSFIITRRVGQKLLLKANTVVLNSVYRNLRLTWFLNNNTYKEYDVTDLRLVDEELVSPITWNHSGEWKSVVFQDQLGLNWTTSWYRLRVNQKANWATYLLEEDLLKGKFGENEIIIYVAVALLLIFAIILATSFTIFIIRLRKYFKKLQKN